MSNVPLPPIYENHAGKWIDVDDCIAHAAAVSAAKDAEIAGLRAEVAGLREDAERYRWLRDKLDVSDQATWNIFMSEGVEQWDAAIDAARKGEA